MDLLLMHNFTISCIGQWEMSYTDLPNVNRFHCIIFFKSHTLIPIDLIIKSFMFWEAVKLKVADINFPKL